MRRTCHVFWKNQSAQVSFVDAVHPTHGARAAGCWAAKDEHLAIEQTTGRQRLNIHGAIDLETGRTKMIEAEESHAASTIKLLAGIEALYSTTALIHVFLDNARYHHAKIVRKWLSQPGRRIALHFVPSYCPHLESHSAAVVRHVPASHPQTDLPNVSGIRRRHSQLPVRDEVPRKWGEFCDSVTDNFRVVFSPPIFALGQRKITCTPPPATAWPSPERGSLADIGDLPGGYVSAATPRASSTG